MWFLFKLNGKVSAIILIVFSSVFTTGGKLMVKFLPNYHPIVIVTYRCFILSCFWILPVLWNKQNVLGNTRNETFLLVLRGFLGFLAFILSYCSLYYITLADATTIVLSAPIYTPIFARLFFKEKCPLFQIILIIFTLSGIILIAKPTFIFNITSSKPNEKDKLIGICLAFSSSIFSSLATIVIRKLKDSSVSLIVFWFAFSSFIYGVIGSLILKLWSPIEFTNSIRFINSYPEFIYLLINGLTGLLSQRFITMALVVEEACVISLIRSIDIPFAFITQTLFLKNEIILLTSILGAVILGSGVVLTMLIKINDKCRLVNFIHQKEEKVEFSTKKGEFNLAFILACEDKFNERIYFENKSEEFN